MRNERPPVVNTCQALATPIQPAPAREYQELWFSLTNRSWRTLVLVPADEGGSAAGIGTALAEVGRWLRAEMVTLFIMSNPLDYASATPTSTSVPDDRGDLPARSERVIFAIQPVVVEPLGLATTQVADAVILCVEMGRSRLSSVRRSIELIGRDRIAGCVLLR